MTVLLYKILFCSQQGVIAAVFVAILGGSMKGREKYVDFYCRVCYYLYNVMVCWLFCVRDGIWYAAQYIFEWKKFSQNVTVFRLFYFPGNAIICILFGVACTGQEDLYEQNYL